MFSSTTRDGIFLIVHWESQMPKVIRRDEITCDVYEGNCLEVLTTLPSNSVHCCVTSPPYFGLRDYGVDGQIGLESTPAAYVARLVEVFREVRRVLRDDGTLWLNLGDSYAANGARTNNNGEGASTMGWKGQRKETLNKAAKMELPQANHGLKPKDLIGIPWRVAFALQADGWYLRQDIIWHKPNPMPESVKDRCTKAHEYIFLLSKSPKYYFDNLAIKEEAIWKETRPSGMARNDESYRNKVKHANDKYGGGGTSFQGHSGLYKANGELINPDGKRNKRSVWTVTTKPFKGAHFATFPPALIEPCILAGCPVGGTVLDTFSGSGTTGMVALNKGRSYIGIELNPDYVRMSCERITNSKCDTRS